LLHAMRFLRPVWPLSACCYEYFVVDVLLLSPRLVLWLWLLLLLLFKCHYYCCSTISHRGWRCIYCRPWDGPAKVFRLLLLLPSTSFSTPPLFDLFLCSDYYYYYSVGDVLLLFPLLVVAGRRLLCLPIAVALRYHPVALYGSGLLHLSRAYRYSSCS